MLTLPGVVKVCASVAVANALTGDEELRPEAAVETTATALPIWVLLALKTTLPVGPAPLLCVVTFAVSVTGVFVVMAVAGAAVTVVTVGAVVMVTGFAGEVLAV